MLTAQALVTALLQHYGLQVQRQRALPGELDQNVAVDLVDGSRVVVKVSPQESAEGNGQVAWQNAVLRHLERVGDAAVLPVPRLRTTLDGEDLVETVVDGVAVSLRVLSWLPGTMLSELPRHPPALLHELGGLSARLTEALTGLALPPGAPPTHHWDLLRAPEAVASVLPGVRERERRDDVAAVLAWFGELVEPVLDELPRGVVHQDLNDFNVLAAPGEDARHHVSGVLDFSDALHTARVSDLAVAVAYAVLRAADPLGAAESVVAGYDAVRPLTDAELSVVFPLAAARLCVNATTWTARCAAAPDGYGASRVQHTWPVLARLARTSPTLAHTRLRQATAREPLPELAALRRWLAAPSPRPVPVLHDGPASDVDLSMRGDHLDGLQDLARTAPLAAPQHGTAPLAGRHLEARAGRLARRRSSAPGATRRLGVDLFVPAGTPLLAPLPGEVEPETDGALVLLHDAPGAPAFWTRWTGLQGRPAAGAQVPPGGVLGTAGPGAAVGVQVLGARDLLSAELPDHVLPAEAAAWAVVSPDVSALLGVGRPDAAWRWDVSEVVRVRRRHFAPSQRSYYSAPMNLVRGEGVWLYDEDALGYLDAVNNVTHVGHANPRVAAAASRQLQRLNTNSRFVYDGIARYAERLVATLPAPLEVVFLVCTGSEANDLALRISRQVTGREDVLVIEGAYHGGTSAVTGISPDRYRGPGGAGPPPTTHEVVQPDRYRGRFGYDDAAAGVRYAADVRDRVAGLVAAGTPPAAFFAESLMGTAGTVLLPEGYLREAFAAVRGAGGLCVSDEVQVGFGRLGTHFWGFEQSGVVPDIVTLGKPMGNGHPMAAVVTTRAVAEAFDTGMRYFNTFGGNPVSCEIGLAVLDEIERGGLQQRAADTGSVFLDRLRGLADRHPLLGDVRGSGLYLGVELVRDRASKEPATAEAKLVSERMKEEGVLVQPTGSRNNVLKIKPPMVFGPHHADLFVETLDEVLTAPW